MMIKESAGILTNDERDRTRGGLDACDMYNILLEILVINQHYNRSRDLLLLQIARADLPVSSPLTSAEQQLRIPQAAQTPERDSTADDNDEQDEGRE